MLSGHVPDEAVELLVAHTFADPGPFDEPHGAAAALLRFFKLVVRAAVEAPRSVLFKLTLGCGHPTSNQLPMPH